MQTSKSFSKCPLKTRVEEQSNRKGSCKIKQDAYQHQESEHGEVAASEQAAGDAAADADEH